MKKRGKTPEELGLKPSKIEEAEREPRREPGPDPQGFIAKIEWMLNDGRFTFAEETLFSIKDQTEERGYSLRQKIAVENIYYGKATSRDPNFEDL